MRHLLPIFLVACGTSPTQPSSAPKTEPEVVNVRIAGSETLASRLLPSMVDGMRADGMTGIDVAGGASSGGIQQLIAGNIDIAASTRSHTRMEQTKAESAGFSLDDAANHHVIGMDLVAVYTHPKTPVGALTYDQVIGIFCEGTIDDQQFLMPNLDSLKLKPVARAKGSGTRALFEDYFCGAKGLHESVEVMDREAIERTLTTTPGAITFNTMTEPLGKALGLRPDGKTPAILPSQKALVHGSYPLHRDLYLYTRPNPSAEVREFIAYAQSPAGQDLVDELRFAPVHQRDQSFDSPRPLREIVQFDPSSTNPNQRSMARLQLLVAELASRIDERNIVILEGYTDASEPDAMVLSTRRAEAVKELLTAELPTATFQLRPMGTDAPLASNETPSGRQRNRRVQVRLVAAP